MKERGASAWHMDALRDNEDVDVGSNSKLANSSWNGGLAGMEA